MGFYIYVYGFPIYINVDELLMMAANAAMNYWSYKSYVQHFDPSGDPNRKTRGQKKEIAKRLGRRVSTNIYEDQIIYDVENPDRIDAKFESIGGFENVKRSLYESAILPLKRPELFAHGKLLKPQKGILLYGPPGTGKTTLAKALAKEFGAVFINLKMSTIMGKWHGDSEKLVSAVFSLANKLQPAIIFIDEVDSFLGRRDSIYDAVTNRMKTEFMALWDGFTTDQNARVMVLAATNRPSDLDEAVLRRLPLAFEIGLPNCSERVSILKVILKGENMEDDIDFDHIASLCDGYAGSDLLELCKQAAYLPIRELLCDEMNGNPSHTPRLLSQSDLEKVLSTSKKTSVAAREYNERKNSLNQAIESFMYI